MAANVFSALADLWEIGGSTNDYVTRPCEWAHQKAQANLWSRQRDIMESVRDNRYTAVHAAHGMGKSFIAADVMAWWIDSHPPGEAFVVSTAPTAAQVGAILWRELGKVHRVADLNGRITRSGYPQWFIGNELVGYGRKPADYEESAFQGIHAKYVLVVIDEACGVARHLYDAIDALVTTEHSRVLAIGNPDDPGSHFASVCKPDSGWNVIHLDALRSPNFSEALVVGSDLDNPRFPLTAALMAAENIPFSTEQIPQYVRDVLTPPLWVEERIRRWAGVPANAHLELAPDELQSLVRRRCAASSIFQAKVRGIFPAKGTVGVIPLGWVQQAINRWRDLQLQDFDGPGFESGDKVIGVDVARGGEDETVFAIRYGNAVKFLEKHRVADTMEVAVNVAKHLHEPKSVAVVDVIGIGAGVYDKLRELKREFKIVGRPIAFNAAAQSHKKDLLGEFRFRNDRSAAWWHMRELLDPSRGSNIALPDDERMLEELVAPQYEHLVNGIIQVESKDKIKVRLGRSTDSADAVIQSFWIEGKRVDWQGVPYDDRLNAPGVVRYENAGNPFEAEDGYTTRQDDPYSRAGAGSFAYSGGDLWN